MADDFRWGLNTKELSDITLKVDGKIAHSVAIEQGQDAHFRATKSLFQDA